MKMDSIIDFLGYIVIKLVSVIFRFIPMGFALWLGRRFGDMAYLINSKRRLIAYANLKSAFPDKPMHELKRINRRHFENLSMNIIELLKLPGLGPEYFARCVELRNVERVREALAKNKGVILLTGHFGNWEMAPIAASMEGYSMCIFAREQKYTRLNNFLNSYREMTGCRVIVKGFSVRNIITALNDNGILGILSDQDAGLKGVFVDFLGRPASMAKGPVVFSMRTGAQILPSFIWRSGYDRHMVQIGEPFELVNTGNEEQDLRVNLKGLADILADYIRRFPEQWLWAHKRWKSTTQRTVLVLSDGKPGHFNQALAIAEMIEEALYSKFRARGINEKPIVKIHIIELKFKNKITKILLNIASIFANKKCHLSQEYLKAFLRKESFNEVKNKYADIVISCGASLVAPNIFLSYENNAKSIVIMKPGLYRYRKIDLNVLARHDAPRKISSNMLITESAPNRITENVIEGSVKKMNGEGRGVNGGVGILIGGDTKGYRLDKRVLEKVLDGVIRISEEKNIDMFISTSRRTSSSIDKFLKDKLKDNPHCKLLIIANEKNIEGAVPLIFGLSNIIITSPESISMISEAVSSGKYVVVFNDNNINSRNKYVKHIKNLEEPGYIKISQPEEIFDTIREIWRARPAIRKMDDRKRIVERLVAVV